MKTILIFFLIIFIFASNIYAQSIYNDGARIISESGSYWVIDNGNFTIISQNAINPATMANLNIESNASLTIKPTSSLTVTGTLTDNNSTGNGGVIIQSDASGAGSLITTTVSGSGVTTVQRYLSGEKWHMVSSPVIQTVSAFLGANSNIPTKEGNLRGMMDYATATNTWNPFFTSSTIGNTTTGKGFMLRTSNDGTLYFTGNLNAGSSNVAVNKIGENGWNCIGNPFSSAINLNFAASAGNNFISINSGFLDPSYNCIYVWDEAYSVTQYSIINQASAAAYASVGQGFFVKPINSSNIQFRTTMQTHLGSVSLKSKSTSFPEIKLFATNDNKKVSTSIKFIEGATKGLDVGYDAGILKIDPSLALYSKLIKDNGVEFALQCLPDNAYKDLVISVGIDSKTGGDVVFSAETINLSADCKVIFEDKLTNTYTDLASNVYKSTIASNSSISDRFYLHTSIATTGLNANSLSGKLTAFANRNIDIRLKGEVTKNAIATLFDVYGRIVLVKKLQAGNLNIIPTPNIKTGIYMLSVKDTDKMNGFKILVRY